MSFDALDDVEDIEIIDNESTQIDISLLKTNPYQPRLQDTDIQTLAQSILDHGQLQPIVINQDNIIIGGHRRYFAHLHLNKETIKCTKVHTSNTELYTLALVENEERENLTDLERGLSYKIALDNQIFKNGKELAAALNKSASHITKMLNLLKLPTTIQKDIRENNRKPSVDTLNCLMSIEDEEKINQTYFKYIKGELNRTDIKNIAKNQKDEKNKVEKAIVKIVHDKLKVDYDLKGLDKDIQAELEKEVQELICRYVRCK